MTHQKSVAYANLAGARKLLEPYNGWNRRIPDDAADWQRELFPLIRGIKNAESDGGHTLREIAAEIRTAADFFEAFPDGSHGSLAGIPQATTESRTPEALREVAEHLENWGSDWRTWEENPMDVWELSLRFPRLSQILPIYFGQDGLAVSDDMQDARSDDGIRMYIDQTHPRCPWHLPSVVSECYQAMALFHTEEQLDRFFTGTAMGGGSGSEDFVDFFPLFARLCLDHMREAHSSLWEGE